MKARIKETEDVINVVYDEHYKMWYRIGTVCFYFEDQLEFLYNDSLEEKGKTGEESDNIDWEQRRYEIAKELMKSISASSHNQYATAEILAQWSVGGADALIAELKKGDNNE